MQVQQLKLVVLAVIVYLAVVVPLELPLMEAAVEIMAVVGVAVVQLAGVVVEMVELALLDL
jgi:hypothetical protein